MRPRPLCAESPALLCGYRAMASSSVSPHAELGIYRNQEGREAAAMAQEGSSGPPSSSDLSVHGHGHLHGEAAVDWDWGFVIGRTPGRKPAIKRPQRHQWYFCNPNYDALRPLPRRILPPHAPPSAAEVDDWRLFQARLGSSLPGDKARKEFVRYLKLRDVDWRDAFQRGLAAHVTEFKRVQRADAEGARQRAWHEYRRRVFEKVLDKDGEAGADEKKAAEQPA